MRTWTRQANCSAVAHHHHHHHHWQHRHYEQQHYLSECSSLAPADWLIPNNIGSNDKRSNRLSISNSSNTCCLTWAIVAATCQLHLLLLLLLLDRQQHVVYQVPTDFIMCCCFCCCCQRQLSSGKFRAIGMPTTKCRETKATATTNAYFIIKARHQQQQQQKNSNSSRKRGCLGGWGATYLTKVKMLLSISLLLLLLLGIRNANVEMNFDSGEQSKQQQHLMNNSSLDLFKQIKDTNSYIFFLSFYANCSP